jgi:hypothetical protein
VSAELTDRVFLETRARAVQLHVAVLRSDPADDGPRFYFTASRDGVCMFTTITALCECIDTIERRMRGAPMS